MFGVGAWEGVENDKHQETGTEKECRGYATKILLFADVGTFLLVFFF